MADGVSTCPPFGGVRGRSNSPGNRPSHKLAPTICKPRSMTPLSRVPRGLFGVDGGPAARRAISLRLRPILLRRRELKAAGVPLVEYFHLARVFTFPVRSTEKLFVPIGSANVVLTEPSESIGAENVSPLLVFTESSLPVSARSKNKFETSASLQSGGEPGSSPGFARQASASATGAAPTTPSTMRAASVRMLSSNTANRGGPTCLKLTRCGWLRRQNQTGTTQCDRPLARPPCHQ